MAPGAGRRQAPWPRQAMRVDCAGGPPRRGMGWAASIRPSGRGELEIIDVNRAYLERGDLHVRRLGPGYARLDTGAHDSLYEAAAFVRTPERRLGAKVMCPEEIGFELCYLSAEQVLARAVLGKTDYADYLRRRIGETS